MEEWKEYRIGEIAQTNLAQYSLSENWAIIQYLDTGSITKNQVSNISLYSGNTDLPSRARRKVKDGDIIFSAVRPNLCHYGYMDNPPSNLLVSTGFVVITVNAEIVDSRFLYYYLTQNEIVNHLHAIGEQAVSTYPTIRPSDIEDLSVFLPPLCEQKRISSILYSLDSKISCNSRINDNFIVSFFLLTCFILWLLKLRNDNLEHQAQSIFKSWFIDYEPFMDSEFVESERGMIPERWRVGTLSELGEVVGGSTPSKAKSQYYTQNGIAWLTPKDLSISQCKFTAKGEIDITQEGYDSCSTKMMPKGTVLFSSRAPIGYITIAKNEICTNQGFKSVVPIIAGTAFIYYFLKHSTKEIENKATGSTFKEASGSLMKSLPTIIPTKPVLDSFEEIMKPIFVKQESLEDESRHLTQLRDTILPKLMSGELKISDLTV